MNGLFIGLFLVSIVGLVVALIKPFLVNLSSRKQSFWVFGGATAFFFVLMTATMPPNQSSSNVPATSSQSVTTTISSSSQETFATPVAAPKTSARIVSASVNPVKTSVQVNSPQPATTPVPPPAPIPVSKPQPQVLLSASGQGTKSTKSFTVSGDWQMDYSYDCSSFGSQGNFQVYITNENGSSNALIGPNELGMSGSDTDYYHQSGTFYLEVNSECSWNVEVKG